VMIVALSVLLLFSTHEAPSLAKPSVSPNASASTRGAAAFEGGAFGGLSLEALDSHAMPWRLVSSALVLQAQMKDPDLPANKETLDKVLASFGFLSHGEPINRPEGIFPAHSELPIGFTHADLAPFWGMNIRVANLGCAACHAGVTYDRLGNPKPEAVWLGMPNTSLNLEAYTLATFEAFRAATIEPKAFWTTVQTLHPDLDPREFLSLKYILWPLIKRRLSSLKNNNRPLPFPNGLPGSTNGVAALKFVTGVELEKSKWADNGIVSIPELGYRHWRTSLLVDGADSLPGRHPGVPTKLSDIDQNHLQGLAKITTFFTVPSIGVSSRESITHLDEANDIFAFLSRTYKPMNFPGKVDWQLAKRGHGIFSIKCASCHGSYDWNNREPILISYPNWMGDVGTDSLRAENFTQSLADKLNDTQYADLMEIKSTGSYVAPPLTGLWASAPFLHNGSIPTLDDLLHPDKRPVRFLVGGHALDFEKVGVRLLNNGKYPQDHQPFSKPAMFDTNVLGQSNSGHTHGAELTDEDKNALLEYLKLL
jgi:processive rubber oxygenase RoxA-like protein